MAKRVALTKLSKRTLPKSEKAAPELKAEEPALFTMPDPEAAVKPVKHKVPGDPISHTCSAPHCGIVSTVYVDDASRYDETARIELFKKRGSRYRSPSMCRWCIDRTARARRKVIE